MKLLKSKYPMKGFDSEDNLGRVNDLINEEVSKRFKSEDIPLEVSYAIIRSIKLLDLLTDEELSYCGKVILNSENNIVLCWFPFSGTSTISILISNRDYIYSTRNNPRSKLLTTSFDSRAEVISSFKEDFNSIPDYHG